MAEAEKGLKLSLSDYFQYKKFPANTGSPHAAGPPVCRLLSNDLPGLPIQELKKRKKFEPTSIAPRRS